VRLRGGNDIEEKKGEYFSSFYAFRIWCIINYI
jgi:hypothetical protein